LVSDAAVTVSTQVSFRPNGSSTTGNYFSGNTNGTASLLFGNSNSNSSNKNVAVVIENVDDTLPKYCSSMIVSAGGQKTFYYDGNAITSVDVLPGSGTFNNTGNIYLFGRY
jgi:hypothetical protein